ncbi:hypothetical protein [Helicobacter pylori]|uniref:hypothetical protein n=1 Tax=Helicobacter pylori TaxID=210 RepID=UPI0027381DBA|nr:hypothetical protein [Helicobacter pylori]
MLFKCFTGRDKKNDYGLDCDFSNVLGCELIECNDLMVKDLIEIDKENKFITSQLKGMSFCYGSFNCNVGLWLKLYIKNYIRHLYGSDREFNYGIFKNGNCSYILAYYLKHLRDIKGMVEFDDAIDFLEKMRAMKKE